MGILHRQLAVGRQRRIGPLGRRPRARHHVGDHEDLGHRLVRHGHARKQGAVVLDLGPEQVAQRHQQPGVLRDLAKIREQQQAAGIGQGLRQALRHLLGERFR
jgi:hypothetical protein